MAGYNDPYDVLPVSQAAVPARVAYLRKLGVLTLGSLGITTVAAIASVMALLTVPALGSSPWISIGLMLGGIYGAQFIGGSMVASPVASTRITGFVLGSALSGMALGFVLLSAAALGMAQYGNPLVFIGQAGGLVFLTVVGMVMYLMTGPRELSMVGSMMSMLTLPMLGLMVITWAFPVGGVMGMLFSAVFVVMSAAGLLYSLNQVLHRMSTDMVMAGAFHVSLGIVILFWNVLSLLMRMGRD